LGLWLVDHRENIIKDDYVLQTLLEEKLMVIATFIEHPLCTKYFMYIVIELFQKVDIICIS
jgi:hypothetical protein